MLKLELVPGKSLGDFLLGMSISEAILAMQQNMDEISMVELKFNEAEPLSMDIVVDLAEDGILLRFEPHTQRLKMIEVYDVPRVCLSYGGTVFSSHSLQPTFVQIYSRFGPSYPGDYEASRSLYQLHYPGVSFTFPIPGRYHSLYLKGDDLPVEFPDGTTPVTSRIYVYIGQTNSSSNSSSSTTKSITSSDTSKSIFEREDILAPLPPNSTYFEEVIIRVGQGLHFTRRGCTLTFDSSAQDVISELGMPSKVFYKEEDKMRIHSAASSSSSNNSSTCPDYFYNYFNLGIDFLFDHHRHTVKKFILHTNFPTHQEFNQYVKCNFKIVGENSFTITPDTKWDSIVTNYAGGRSSKPVVNNRGSSANPFGATYFYGFRDIVFEVMRNGHVASVCLFSSSSAGK